MSDPSAAYMSLPLQAQQALAFPDDVFSLMIFLLKYVAFQLYCASISLMQST